LTNRRVTDCRQWNTAFLICKSPQCIEHDDRCLDHDTKSRNRKILEPKKWTTHSQKLARSRISGADFCLAWVCSRFLIAAVSLRNVWKQLQNPTFHTSLIQVRNIVRAARETLKIYAHV
jgi:hypothetical protein